MRAIFRYSPNLDVLVCLDDAEIKPEIRADGSTFFLAERHDHWVLYKRAISGWGGVTKQAGRPGGENPDGPDARQR
jgi:hypothetical protein